MVGGEWCHVGSMAMVSRVGRVSSERSCQPSCSSATEWLRLRMCSGTMGQWSPRSSACSRRQQEA